MHEMFRLATMEDIAVNKFPELFSSLLIVLGSYVGTSPPINTPQNSKGQNDKPTFIPNRNAYKLNPARYGIIINMNVLTLILMVLFVHFFLSFFFFLNYRISFKKHTLHFRECSLKLVLIFR